MMLFSYLSLGWSLLCPPFGHCDINIRSARTLEGPSTGKSTQHSAHGRCFALLLLRRMRTESDEREARVRDFCFACDDGLREELCLRKRT